MTLAQTKLILLDALGQSVLTVDGNGENQTVLLENLDKAPDGVFVDARNGHLYATQMGTVDLTNQTSYPEDGSIWRMNVDASYPVMLIGDGAIQTPKQITADLSAGKLYWSDREGMRVMRANLDGSDIEVLVETGVKPDDQKDQRHWPVGIAVDPERRQVYFTLKGNPDSGQGSIRRMGYDLPKGETPATRSDVEVLFDDLPEPIDLHLDTKGGYLYWSDRGDLPGGNSVSRAAIAEDGSLGQPEVLLQDLGEAIGVLVDHDSGHIFASSLSGGLYRARLDGSDLTQIGKFGGLTGLARL